jgi:hypothetical protein
MGKINTFFNVVRCLIEGVMVLVLMNIAYNIYLVYTFLINLTIQKDVNTMLWYMRALAKRFGVSI